MAGEAAIRKVLLALRDALDGNLGGASVIIDRAFDEPFRDEELPAVNIRCQQVTRDQIQHNSIRHTANVMFDIITRSSTTHTVDARQSEIEADIAAILMNETPVIVAGNAFDLITDIFPLGIGQSGNDLDMADEGESTSAWRVQFLTPIDNFRIIAGRLGPVA